MSNLNRRDFIKVAGVTAAAGAAACDPRVPMENVLPYVVQPEQIVPGTPTFFATLCNECPSACGTVAKVREGRVVKLEGNPEHPANHGRLCSRGQQGILGTYSPDRFAGPMVGGAAATWDAALAEASKAISEARAAGKKVAWLGQQRSGATGALIGAFVGALGGSAHYWEPISGIDSLRAATKAVFGLDTVPSYDLAPAHTVVSFGADFLGTWGNVSIEQGWADSRDPARGGFISRTVCVEPRVGTSSAMADLHLACAPGTEASVAMALARLVAQKKGYSGPALALVSGAPEPTESGVPAARLEEVATWMAANPSVVLPGGVHTSGNATELAIATLLLNEVAGNVGATVTFGQTPTVAGIASHAEVAALVKACGAGEVGVLFLDGADPAYALPAELGAADALGRTKVIAFANEPNDSLGAGAIVLPPGSTLETWGDAEAMSGWHTLQQAVMRPLKDTRGMGDVLLGLAQALQLAPAATATAPAAEAPAAVPTAAPTDGAAPPLADGVAVAPLGALEAAPAPAPVAAALPTLAAPDFATWLKGWWEAVVFPKTGTSSGFTSFWNSSLQRGGVFLSLARTGAAVVLGQAPAAAPAPASGSGDLTLLLFPHPFLHDGRHANKPWAQEVPEPISSYTWGTWAELHPKTAEKLGLTKTDAVVVKTDKGQIEVAWFGSLGIREDVVAVVMGNGHKAAGRYAKYGANPMALVGDVVDSAGALHFGSAKATVSKGGPTPIEKYLGNIDQDGRGINYTVSIEDLGKGYDEHTIFAMHHPPVDARLKKAGLNDMYPEPEHPTYRFAMAVDLNRCTGCGACETACFAENNTAIVGPTEVAKSRHMGWIRLSRYWEAGGETPDLRFQPVMCQQCSHAPCEGVCPVLATYHNLDGLNAMIYNRCVGTRYCGNNCPYTARRFNYHSYLWPESFHMMLNPEVSTREMGVMEKCTFCVQRLRSAKDSYRDQGMTVPDSALRKITACAQACPTDAITFGNANDPEGEVSKLWKSERAFAMLGELNTKPGVRYLARIQHIPSKAKGHGGGHAAGHGDGGHGDAGHGGADAGGHGTTH
jgi:molybdopterin-containing oxidoreductase family iron-sulfur binding subunit